ncbi:MAG: regulator of sigma E protease [Pseudohongiellaceae bacterium]|jgi:regulator of sigma E protease
MEVIQSVLSLLLTLGILVTIHEFGHFWVARRCGVKVLRFSVGFGKPIFSWSDKSGTEFVIAMIPLGGYVKMLDEREAPVEENLKPFAFNRKTVSQRIAIVAAGPIANFIFAIFAYWLMFLSGFNVLIPNIGSVESDSIAANAGLTSGYEITAVDDQETSGWRAVSMALINRIGDTGMLEVDAYKNNAISLDTANSLPSFSASGQRDVLIEKFSLPIEKWLQNREPKELLSSLGIQPLRPVVPAIMGKVLKDSPAEQGGLLFGDHVIGVNDIKINAWHDFVEVVHASPEKEIQVDLVREDVNQQKHEIRLYLKPGIHQDELGNTYGRLGVSAKSFTYPSEMIREVSYGPFVAISYAAAQTWSDTKMSLNAIKKMVQGLISLENLSGPITIAQVASDSISSGAEEFLRFLALLSISLGILNLLPIPVLDGGHLLYYTFEALRGKPLSEKWQAFGLKIGVSFILMLMTVAFYNDVMRLL